MDIKEFHMTKDSKEAKEGLERQNWLDQFLQCKIWKMAEGGEGEGDKSRIKSASSQGWQALKSNKSTTISNFA